MYFLKGGLFASLFLFLITCKAQNNVEINIPLGRFPLYSLDKLEKTSSNDYFQNQFGGQFNFYKVKKNLKYGLGGSFFKSWMTSSFIDSQFEIRSTYGSFQYSFYANFGYIKALKNNKVQFFADASLGFWYTGQIETNNSFYKKNIKIDNFQYGYKEYPSNYFYSNINLGAKFYLDKGKSIYLNALFTHAFYFGYKPSSYAFIVRNDKEIGRAQITNNYVYPNYFSLGIGYSWPFKKDRLKIK